MTSKHESTKLENSTYNILSALGKEAQFLYSTIDTYIRDAEQDNRPHLIEIWKTLKKDSQNHEQVLREALEKDAHEEKLK
jgi:hypothetical protein